MFIIIAEELRAGLAPLQVAWAKPPDQAIAVEDTWLGFF